MADHQPYPGTDPVLQKINALLNDVVSGVLVRALEADIIAAQPWMGFPGWRQLWQLAFEWLITKAEDRGYKFVSSKLTDAQVSAQEAASQKANDAMASELSKPAGEQDDAKIQKELDDFDRAMEGIITMPHP